MPCSAQQGWPLRPRPSPGVTDAAFTALPRSSLHQRSRRTQTPAQGEGTNLLQSPTHSSAAGQQLCKGNVSMPFSLESRVNPFNPPNKQPKECQWMSPEKLALAEGISTLILLSGQQSCTHLHSQLTQCRTQHRSCSLRRQLLIMYSGHLPHPWLMLHSQGVSRMSHHGFTPAFSPYRNTAELRAHPDCNQH